MRNEQIIIGGGTALLCLLGIWETHWFLQQTRKGQRLVRWLGYERAVIVLRGLFAAGIAFGMALAADWIRPIQW